MSANDIHAVRKDGDVACPAGRALGFYAHVGPQLRVNCPDCLTQTRPKWPDDGEVQARARRPFEEPRWTLPDVVRAVALIALLTWAGIELVLW